MGIVGAVGVGGCWGQYGYGHGYCVVECEATSKAQTKSDRPRNGTGAGQRLAMMPAEKVK